MYKLFFKRLIDFTVALILLVSTFPFIIILIILLALVNQGKPFFTQLRPGKNEKIFKLIKFKTMNDKLDSNGELLPDSQRLTTVGKIVRSLSLDELPQLINVLKGDMSLIGPRPLLIEYLELYNQEQKRRHLVRPGISGWAQVNGRNLLSWEQKFEFDVFYVDHQSFKLDFQIFFKTIKNILVREGISSENSSTMEKFKGN